MKIKKKKHPIYVSIKFYEAKLPDLLLIGEEGNRHYVLVKDLNIFIYNNTLHSGRN